MINHEHDSNNNQNKLITNLGHPKSLLIISKLYKIRNSKRLKIKILKQIIFT